ncbi:hypothetical protein EDD22DRAFT_950406 [Suillus occidentalis]|nr:hypothetical protein EDD22DRAFT_950406 [Suillus occidentalis]
MAAFDLSMLNLSHAPTPVPTPAPSPEPEEITCKESLTLNNVAPESTTVAQPEPEPEPEDVCILHGWNASLATMCELHEVCPELHQECFQQLEDWLHHWDLLNRLNPE